MNRAELKLTQSTDHNGISRDELKCSVRNLLHFSKCDAYGFQKYWQRKICILVKLSYCLAFLLGVTSCKHSVRTELKSITRAPLHCAKIEFQHLEDCLENRCTSLLFRITVRNEALHTVRVDADGLKYLLYHLSFRDKADVAWEIKPRVDYLMDSNSVESTDSSIVTLDPGATLTREFVLSLGQKLFKLVNDGLMTERSLGTKAELPITFFGMYPCRGTYLAGEHFGFLYVYCHGAVSEY